MKVLSQVAITFSKSRPITCTYRLGPNFRQLAYGTAPFGPFESIIINERVFVSVHARYIASHRTVVTGAYIVSFLEITGRSVQQRPSRLGLSNLNYNRPLRANELLDEVGVATLHQYTLKC